MPKRYVYLGWLAMVSTASLLAVNLFVPVKTGGAIRIVSLVLLLSSPVLFVPPFVTLSKHRRSGSAANYMETSAVVSEGLYALVRHPQYLGYIFLNLGFALRSGLWLSLALGVISTGLLVALSAEEEKELRCCFGRSYEEYCRRVPRFNVVLGAMRYLRGRIGRFLVQ